MFTMWAALPGPLILRCEIGQWEHSAAVAALHMH